MDTTYHFVILKRSKLVSGNWIYTLPVSMHYLGSKGPRNKFARQFKTYRGDSAMLGDNSLYNVKIFDSNLALEVIIPTDDIEEFQKYPLVIDYTKRGG